MILIPRHGYFSLYIRFLDEVVLVCRLRSPFLPTPVYFCRHFAGMDESEKVIEVDRRGRNAKRASYWDRSFVFIVRLQVIGVL